MDIYTSRHNRKQIEIVFFFRICAFYAFIHNFDNEFHEVVGFLGKSQTDEGVDSECTVADPTVPIIPIPRSSKIFGKGECGGSDECSSWLIS